MHRRLGEAILYSRILLRCLYLMSFHREISLRLNTATAKVMIIQLILSYLNKQTKCHLRKRQQLSILKRIVSIVLSSMPKTLVGASVLVWGWDMINGCSSLYVLNVETVTRIHYLDEILCYHCGIFGADDPNILLCARHLSTDLEKKNIHRMDLSTPNLWILAT